MRYPLERNALLLIAGVYLSLTPNPIQAQDPGVTTNAPMAVPLEKAKSPSTDLTPGQLPEIVVTATRTPEDVTKIPQSITVIGQDVIQRNQAQTPNQMLREAPGIFSPQVANQGSPIIRGQIGNRILYLWDGLPINNGALFGGPNGNFNQFPIGAIDHIEVLRGPGSVMYGSGAIGGVINIISKKVDPFPTGLEYGSETSVRYGTVNDEMTETADFWLADTNFSVQGDISAQNVGNYRGPDVGILPNTGFNALGGNVNMAYRPFENSTFRLSSTYNDRSDVDYYAQSKMNSNGIPRVFNPDEERSLTKLEYGIDNMGVLSSELKMYTYYQSYDQVRLKDTETVGTRDTNTLVRVPTQQDILGGGVQNTTPIETSWGDHKFTTGTDYRSEDLRSSQSQSRTITPSGTTVNSVPSGKTPDGMYGVFDMYGLLTLKPTDRWSVDLGGRFESTHMHSYPKPGDVIPNAGYTLNDLKVDKTWNAGTWSAGTVYGITREFDLAGDIATGFRAPTYSDALSTGTPVFSTKTASLPSPSVVPEQSITYEAGPRYHDEKWNVSLTAYWTELTDVVRATTNGAVVINGLPYIISRNSNNGEGYVRGLEFASSYRLSHDWILFDNATYTEGRDTAFNENYRFIPPLNGVVGLRYESPSGRWWAEIAEELVDRLRNHAPSDELDTGFSTDPALGSPSKTNPRINSDFEIPGYAVTNLRGGATVWRGTQKRRLDLTLDINNVLNKSYREAYSQQELVAPGINFVMGARLRF